LQLLLILPLFATGIACRIWIGNATHPGPRPVIAMWITLALFAAVSLIPQARTAVFSLFNRVANPSSKIRAITASLLALLAAIYFCQTALWEGRQFGPELHDEHCYIIQSRMLAHGRLWMPRHELGDFLDSFHLITDRVYASKYGPGAALFGAPAILIGLDPWIVPLALTSASIALFYLILCEMLDGVAAIVGALMLPALGLLRRTSIEMLSQAPMLFLTMLAIWAFLQWRKNNAARWLVVMSAAVGWAAITRPVDALCLALPLAIGVLLHLRDKNWRRRTNALTIVLLAAAPFLALQLICNKGITGHWLELPWSYYSARNDPYDTISYTPFDPARRSASLVPEIQKFQDDVTIPNYRTKLATPMPQRIRDHTLRPTLESALPHPLLLMLLPVALPALFMRGRWLLPAMFPTFLVVYARHTVFLTHYAIVVAPALILMAILGFETLVTVVPDAFMRASSSAKTMTRWLAVPGLAALVLATYPQFQSSPPNEGWAFGPILRLIDDHLANLGKKPAVVLFHFDAERGNPHIEPVYNTDVAWPDDAPVIRAHDLGPQQNRRLFAYYARQKPDRAIYLFNLANPKEPPQYLGTAQELARTP
jgi:hypothetical protein